MLVRGVHWVERGETVPFHVAAGGVARSPRSGSASTGRESWRPWGEAALALGADEGVVYTREDFTRRAREPTGGAGVPVVYDSGTSGSLVRVPWRSKTQARRTSAMRRWRDCFASPKSMDVCGM